MSTRELERLLDLLAKLSEDTTDGKVRDAIALVRDHVWSRTEDTE